MSVDDGASDYSYTPGFHLGGYIRYNDVKVSYQAEVQYSQQGASIKADGEDLKAIAKYVNVPVIVRFQVVPSFHLNVGPQIGFLTCIKSDYHPVIREPFMEQHYTKAYKKTDFGVVAGAAYEAPKGFLVEVRYYLGLTDITNYDGLGPARNRMIQLSVGYKIFDF